MNNTNQKTNKRRQGIRLDPALKSALIWLLPTLVMRLVTSSFALIWWQIILQLLFYVFCGIIAGRWYHESVKRQFPQGKPVEAQRSGAKAGLTLAILLNVALVIIYLIIFWLFPIGLFGLVGSVFVVIAIPLDLIAGLFLGAFGGRNFFKH